MKTAVGSVIFEGAEKYLRDFFVIRDANGSGFFYYYNK